MIFKRLSCFEGFAVVHKYLQRKENFHVVINYYSKRKLARLFSALTTLYRLGVGQQGLMTLDRWEIVFKANPNFLCLSLYRAVVCLMVILKILSALGLEALLRSFLERALYKFKYSQMQLPDIIYRIIAIVNT